MPDCASSASSALAAVSLTSAITTPRAACLTNNRHVAAPMPDAPPVTMATLPASLSPIACPLLSNVRYFRCIPVTPPHADPPPLIGSNVVLPGPIAREFFQSAAQLVPQVTRGTGRMKDGELPDSDGLDVCRHAARALPPQDLLGLGIPKASS